MIHSDRNKNPPQPPTRDDTRSIIIELNNGKRSREDVGNWARQWVSARDPGVNDEVVWEILDWLAGIDTRISETEYLFGSEDIEDLLKKLE